MQTFEKLKLSDEAESVSRSSVETRAEAVNSNQPKPVQVRNFARQQHGLGVQGDAANAKVQVLDRYVSHLQQTPYPQHNSPPCLQDPC